MNEWIIKNKIMFRNREKPTDERKFEMKITQEKDDENI